MIEENATVVSIVDGRVLIESSRSSACGKCDANKSCGQKTISEWASSKMARLEIDNPTKILVKEGDRIVVGIDEGSFLKVSALMYLLPLLLMICFGGIARYFDYSEVIVATLAFSGLFFGFTIVRWSSQRLEKNCQFKPVLLRVS